MFADWEHVGNEEEEYDRNEPSAWKLKGAKMVQVDGKKIKEDTWYRIENGKILECEEENV